MNTLAHIPPPKGFKQEPRQVAGFFVYRHLGLLGCNIANMKRIIPLLIFTGLLFGQASLLIESLLKELPERIRLSKGKFVTEKGCK